MIFSVLLQKADVKVLDDSNKYGARLLFSFPLFDDGVKFLADDYQRFFEKMLSKNADKIKSAYPKYRHIPAVVSLPDEAIAIERIEIPTMDKSTMKTLVKNEFTSLYKNHDELVYEANLISSNKEKTIYVLYIIRKDILDVIETSFKKYGFQKPLFSCHALLVVDAINRLESSYRNKNYLFADVSYKSTSVIKVSKGRVFGYIRFPLGYHDFYADHRLTLEDLPSREKATNVVKEAISTLTKGDKEIKIARDEKDDALLDCFINHELHEGDDYSYENFKILKLWLTQQAYYSIASDSSFADMKVEINFREVNPLISKAIVSDQNDNVVIEEIKGAKLTEERKKKLEGYGERTFKIKALKSSFFSFGKKKAK